MHVSIWGPLLSVLLSPLPLALANVVNVTVDDFFGDPTNERQIEYSPPDVWNAGPGCTDCTADVDRQRALNATWHDATFNPSPGSNSRPNVVQNATLRFTGTSVFVYCIIAHSSVSPTGRSDMTFTVDNNVVGHFVREPDSKADKYEYNVLVYANTSLALGNHIISIQNGHVDGQKSLILLDYIVYSFDHSLAATSSASQAVQSPSPSQTGIVSGVLDSPRKNSGAIVGGVLGTLAVLLFAGLAFFLYRRYQRKSQPILPNGASPPQPIPVFSRFFGGETSRPISFNPSLLVRRMTNGTPAVRPMSSHARSELPYLIEPPSLPASYGHVPMSAGMTPQSGMPSLHPERIESIQRWQRHVPPQTEGLQSEPRDMSEELSDHYEDPPPVAPSPRLPPPRRFTVMNN